MPATQGAVAWPPAGPSATALVFDEELPLVDASIDRFLLVHSLEHAENPRETLNEIWRALSPAGRVVIVAPNRRGVWARFEHTPFGTGLERSGRRFWPIFSGVIIVEAQKRLYQGLPVAQRASRRVFVPAFRPQSATRIARRVLSGGSPPA